MRKHRVSWRLNASPHIFQSEVGFKVNKCLRPHRDRNAWLAESVANRLRWMGRPEIVYYAMTSQFAVLSESDGPAALALHLLSKEDPEIARQFDEDFDRLVEPFFVLWESGRFIETWRELNPWSARQFPELAGGIARVVDDSLLADLEGAFVH